MCDKLLKNGVVKMCDKGIDFWKYDNIYRRQGVMTKRGGFVGRYGENLELDKKWDRYGHTCEGRPMFDDVIALKPRSILDIGCGYNEFLKAFRSHKYAKKNSVKAVGSDIACPGADIIAPAHNLPFEDSSFDLIVSFGVMEHIPKEEIDLSFKEFARVADRIYLNLALTPSGTRIDGELVHVTVESKDWWLEKAKKYFPNSLIVRHDRKNTIWENITIYSDK